MKNKNMIKAVIFDLWGTLLNLSDVMDFSRKLDHMLGHERYLELYKMYLHAHTKKMDNGQIIMRAEKELQLSAEEREQVFTWLDYPKFGPYPDAIHVLETLKERGYKIGLLSNATHASESSVEEYGLLPYFDATVYSYDVGVLKPDTKMFHEVLDRLQIDPNEAMMVGDSQEKDIDGAHAVGMQTLRIDHHAEASSEDVIHSLSELLNRLK